jgi:ATP-dependent Lhr-like helicase
MLRVLADDGRAAAVEFPGGRRWIAGEETAMYAGIAREENSRGILGRFMMNHGPVTSSEIARRFGIPGERAESIARNLSRTHNLVRGRFLPTAEDAEDQWCYRPNLERIHRKTISILRKEITPSSPAEFADFLHRWQHIHPLSRVAGADGLEAILEQLQGLALPAEIWERDILRMRVEGYTTALHNDLSRQGRILWSGAGAGKMACVLRGEGGGFLQSGPLPTGMSPQAARLLAVLERHGASFYADLRTESGLSLAALNAGIAELFWAGLITNDNFSELLSLRRSARMGEDAPMERVEPVRRGRSHARSPVVQAARRAIRQIPGWSGRWSALRIPAVLGEAAGDEERALRQARQLLARYGILAREFHRREDFLPWPAIALQLQRLEMRGEIRRGYFVQGLSGMQYAHPEAVDELRRAKGMKRDRIILLNTCDPSNPYGGGVALPEAEAGSSAGQLSRVPGSFVGFAGGNPVLWIEGEGARIRTVGRPDTVTVTAVLERFLELCRLPEQFKPLKQIVVEYWDGERPAASSWSGVLRSLGFSGDANQTMRYDRYS